MEVIDQLAFIQHNIIPRREDKNHVFNKNYTNLCGALTYPDWAYMKAQKKEMIEYT